MRTSEQLASMNEKSAASIRDAVRTHWSKSFIRICSRLFAWSRSGFIFKIQTKAFTCNYPSTIFRFESCASDVLLKSERHPPRGSSAFKRNAAGAILREIHCRLTTEQRFIKVKRLASRDAVMDPWWVFSLDLLSRLANRCPHGRNVRIGEDAVNHRNGHLFCVRISDTIVFVSASVSSCVRTDILHQRICRFF